MWLERMIGDFFFQFKRDWKKMQRRHSSNTDNIPPERTRSQTVGSETSVDENGVFEVLKPESSSAQQMFSGLTGLQSGPITASSFQSGLVLGSSLGASVGSGDVFIQMTPQEEGAIRTENMQYHHRHRHHHYHHSHHRSSLLHVSSDRHGNAEDVSDDPGTPAPALSELKAAVTWLQKGLPFILILLAKVCFQHKLGIAVCIGMASTFAYANLTVKHQVSLREQRSVLVTLWILAFLTGNTLFLYYTFSAQELYKSLIFLKTSVESKDFFDLLWIAGITDFVLKYITIGFKCLVLILPRIIVAFKSRYLGTMERNISVRFSCSVLNYNKCSIQRVLGPRRYLGCFIGCCSIEPILQHQAWGKRMTRECGCVKLDSWSLEGNTLPSNRRNEPVIEILDTDPAMVQMHHGRRLHQ
ncbi:RING finger and transmembrane domain-containing protein 2 isoform X3 [Heterodontus francisci]|uniref:RING finger and transmembrane domain-containing protein 2 isoform X3 n=1 Tax=Heterodontus francisci TaxID=7792 RepID=UPI00355B96F8